MYLLGYTDKDSGLIGFWVKIWFCRVSFTWMQLIVLSWTSNLKSGFTKRVWGVFCVLSLQHLHLFWYDLVPSDIKHMFHLCDGRQLQGFPMYCKPTSWLSLSVACWNVTETQDFCSACFVQVTYCEHMYILTVRSLWNQSGNNVSYVMMNPKGGDCLILWENSRGFTTALIIAGFIS